ncbi:YqaA family protein [Rubrobacter taiwanensis]|nr:YqaA family protein [Rubrobacter taiwanensis]
MDFIHSAVEWMIAWSASPYAMAALFIFAFWESSFFPIPPDPLLIAMAVGSPAMALIFAGICTVGSVLGAALGYVVGLKGGRPVAERLFSKEKILAAERLYHRYDVWAIGAAAFTPIPYKVFTITGGMARLNFPRFMLASLLGRGGRFFLVGALILIFGPSIQHLIDQYFELLTIAFMVLLVGGFVAVRYAGRYLARREAAEKRRKALK